MKKIIIFLTPILIFAVVFGCSKDHEAPTFGTYKTISTPENVEATYDSGKDVVNVSWTMADTSGVIAYSVAVSDSSVFDSGEIREFPTGYGVSEYEYKASTYVDAEVKSLVLYFTVSAVFNNETFNYFIGPRAEADSALVNRE